MAQPEVPSIYDGDSMSIEELAAIIGETHLISSTETCEYTPGEGCSKAGEAFADCLVRDFMQSLKSKQGAPL